MMRSSGTGIWVLRLVLQRQGPPSLRGFSTAVVDREKDRSAVESSWNDSSLFPGLKALASRSTSEEDETVIDFLEEEGKEYESIRRVLPARTTTARPIPWPTIFAHPDRNAEAGPSTKIRTRMCDPVARLVEEGDMIAATKVQDELRSVGIRIHPRTIYLQAARAALDSKDVEGFFAWLLLYPNRPATKNHPGLKSTWQPITYRILTDHALDTSLIARYANLCAKKGVLPAIVHDLIRHLTFVASPEVSDPIIDDALSTYIAHTTSSTSTSERAQTHLQIAERQVNAWKDVYRQAVVEHGWDTDQESSDSALSHGVRRSVRPTRIPEHIVGLRDRIAFAIDAPPVAMDLVGIIEEIRARWSTKEEAEFRTRFIRPPGLLARSIHPSPEVRAYEWWRAVLLVESRSNPVNDQAVIDTFQDHFRWFGLPDHPARRTGTASSSDRDLLYPRRSIMTALLPSLLSGMAAHDIIAYHSQYLEQSHQYPPVLKPDAHIHNIFVRAIAHYGSTDAAMAAIRSISTHGYECGSQAMTTVLYALARSSNFDDMFTLLEAMERRDRLDFRSQADSPAPFGHSSSSMFPPPMEVTYDWLANIIRKRRNYHMIAEEVIRRKQAYFDTMTDQAVTEPGERSTG